MNKTPHSNDDLNVVTSRRCYFKMYMHNVKSTGHSRKRPMWRRCCSMGTRRGAWNAPSRCLRARAGRTRGEHTGVAAPSGAVSGRRGAVGGLLAASFGVAANAADDFSALDKLLDKQFSVAQDETRCKTLEEGEQRGFCLAREYDEIECNKAKAAGKPCKAPTTKLGTSGGSYSAGQK